MSKEIDKAAEHRFGPLTAAVRDKLAEYISADAAFFFARAPELETQRAALVAALDALLTFDRVERPAFRAKLVDGPNTTARIANDKLIALEDAALAALASARGEGR